MIFMHIVDDYYLQGILASMKQKQWWLKQENYKAEYKWDYLVALFMHAFSWAFCIMLPIAFKLSFTVGWVFYLVFTLNLVVHFIVDDLKANKLKINLIQDQAIHLTQIIVTFILYILGGFA